MMRDARVADGAVVAGPRWGLPRGVIILLGTASAVVTIGGIRVGAWLIGPAFLALTIVIAISPVQGWFLRKGLPRWLSVLALLVGVYAVLSAIGLVMLVSILRLGGLVPQYQKQADAVLASVTNQLARFNVGTDQLRAAAKSLDWGKVAGVVEALLSGIAGLASNLVFLVALLLFLCVEASGTGARMASIAGDRPQVAAALGDFARGTRKYLVVSTVFGLIVAVLDSVALAIMGIPLAVTWGLLSFITNYIPNIGFVVGVIPPALIALLQGGPGLMAAVIVVYCVLNFVVQTLIQPRFVGDSVGLSVTVTFLVLFIWTWLIGPLGAVLAIPLTLLVKALLVDIDPGASWADALLRDRPITAATPAAERQDSATAASAAPSPVKDGVVVDVQQLDGKPAGSGTAAGAQS
jgi:AI-2 transport protein TqsA